MTVSTIPEIDGLGACIARTEEQINCALDLGDRRQFKIWCLRRASLLARIEKALLSAATAKVPA